MTTATNPAPPLPSLRDLVAVTGMPQVLRLVVHPLRDRDPDPGLFGPDSVTWRVVGEPMMVLGGLRAVLMQVAHPAVAQGVSDHSDYRTNPMRRLVETADWVTAVVFGTRREAEAATQRINQMHRRVTGRIDSVHATDAVAAGTPYGARRRDLAQWVLATFIDSLLVTYERLVQTLPAADADRFVQEWAAVGTLLGLPGERLWSSRAQLSDYITEQLATVVRPGEGSRAIADSLLHSPFHSRVVRRLWPATTMVSVSLLPAALRDGYGISWTAQQERRLRAALQLTRLRPLVPEPLRRPAALQHARRRVEGKLVTRRGLAA